MIAEQLKKSILQAAIQGKLTQQLPEDGDARDLLKEIKKEKVRLIKEGKIKKEKPLPEITEDEIPFEIPDNWCWCYFFDISIKVHYGFTASSTPFGNSKLLRITDIQDDSVDWKKVPYCEINNRQLATYKLEKRDIVVARTGGTIGKTYVITEIQEVAVFASYLIRIIPSLHVSEKYLKYFMESDLYWKQLFNKAQGTGQANVNGQSIKKLMLPLPPLKEQQRIVERIEELLPEIESLKNDETKLEELQKSFPKKMKDAILQYAIQGKLTQQLPEDGDARDLLKDIQKEKAQLIKEGKIKKEKPLPEITEDEIPFEIPENWCWVRLGEIVIKNLGGGTPSKSNPEYWNGGIPWASVKDLNCKFLDSTRDSISEDGLINSSSNLIPAGNLVVCTRMGLGKIVYSKIDVAINQDLRAIILPENISKWYVYYFYLTLNFAGKGATVKGVSIDELSKILLPLPPIKEQIRIVERIEELLPLCEELQ